MADLENQKRLINSNTTWYIPNYKCRKCGNDQQPRAACLTSTSCGGMICAMIFILTIICACCAMIPWGATKKCKAICSACGEEQIETEYKMERRTGKTTKVVSKIGGSYSSNTKI